MFLVQTMLAIGMVRTAENKTKRFYLTPTQLNLFSPTLCNNYFLGFLIGILGMDSIALLVWDRTSSSPTISAKLSTSPEIAGNLWTFQCSQANISRDGCLDLHPNLIYFKSLTNWFDIKNTNIFKICNYLWLTRIFTRAGRMAADLQAARSRYWCRISSSGVCVRDSSRLRSSSQAQWDLSENRSDKITVDLTTSTSRFSGTLT